MTPPRKDPPPPTRDKADRPARLKAALRANLARRKAQGRARADEAAKAPDRKD